MLKRKGIFSLATKLLVYMKMKGGGFNMEDLLNNLQICWMEICHCGQI